MFPRCASPSGIFPENRTAPSFQLDSDPCRPDLVGFVTGLPLVVIELKKPGVPARAAFDEKLTHFKSDSTPHP